MSEESSDEEENNEDQFDIDRETLTKLVETNPDLLNEFFSSQAMEDDETEYDESNQIEYLRKFCDWKKYLNTKELLEDEDDIVDNKLFSNNSTDSNEKSESILSNEILHELSPLMVLELLIIERKMKKKENNINTKSQKEKLEILIKDGANALKHKLYKNKVRYFDANLLKIGDSEQQIFSDAINLSLKLYHKFMLKLNIKNIVKNKTFNKSYSVLHLMLKTQHQNECDKLLAVFNELNYSLLIPNIVISTIAQYSSTIYAKCIDEMHVHFCYGSLMPSKYIYDRLWFVKNKQENTEFDTTYFQDTQEIAQLIHIFEPRHCDPRFISERKFGSVDIMLYYDSIDTYCIISSKGVKIVGLQFPDYLQPASPISETPHDLIQK